MVRGRVLVRVSSGDRCRGVNLVYFWRTHGKGNTDGGEPRRVRLHDGPLEFDHTHEFPFEFRAPPSPFTYHGQLLNVDHYLEASLDLRWATDPKVEEEFLLVPGPSMDVPDEMLHRPLTLAPRGGVGKLAFLGGAAAFFGIISATPLLLIGGGAVLLFGLRRPMARFRMGKVVVHLDSRVLAPDEHFEVALVVRPRQRIIVNGASAVLRAREICTSGSGKHRRTHEHVIYRRLTSLAGPSTLEANTRTELRASLLVPDAGAYTYRSRHNQIVWDLTLHVDIPSWPDWRERQELFFWPAVPDRLRPPPPERVLVGASPEPASSEVPESPPGTRHETDDEEKLVEEVAPIEDSSGQEPTTPEPEIAPIAPVVAEAEVPGASESTPLMVAVQAILEEDRFGPRRASLIEQLIGQTYMFDVIVERMERSFGSLDPEYRGGQTVQGSIAGSEIPISVRFPAARSDELGRPARGSHIPVRGMVVEWQNLHDRPTVEADGGDTLRDGD